MTKENNKKVDSTADTFNKLSIQVSLNGLSFCVADTLRNTILTSGQLDFGKELSPYEVQKELKDLLGEYGVLEMDIAEMVVVHHNSLFSLVPKDLFDSNELANYLKFNAKILLNDLIEYDEIDFGANHLKYELRISKTDSIALWRQDFANSYLMVNQSVMTNPATPTDTTYAYHEFHITTHNYKGQTAKGISLENGTYELIEKKYGKPHEVLRMGNGSILHYEYKDQKLIFHTGPNGKLLRWGIYFVFED